MANKWKILAWDSNGSKWIKLADGIHSESEARQELNTQKNKTGWKCKMEKY